MGLPYIGSGPYCYSNSPAMVLGEEAPPPSAIEVLTGSPFGFHLGGGPAWFDPLGRDPDLGLARALDLLGWSCHRTAGGSAADALERLRNTSGPVFVGPVEFGLLRHHPGSGEVLDSDHFVVVTEVRDGTVHFHDPHGFPFATLPVDEFTAAWESVTFEYSAQPFTMRWGFRRVREVAVADALLASLPAARRLLTPGGESPGEAVERFAGLVGGLQHPLVRGDREPAVELLRRLAPTYAELDAELAAAGVPNSGRSEQLVARNGRAGVPRTREYPRSTVRDGSGPGTREL